METTIEPIARFLRELERKDGVHSVELFRHAVVSVADGTARLEHVAALLAALRFTKLDLSAELIATAAQTMRAYALAVPAPAAPAPASAAPGGGGSAEYRGGSAEYRGGSTNYPGGEYGDGLVDIVGTGGDGQDTFNVSTASGIVAAGAGLRVCKHGNRASTSSSGSADVLEALGCAVTHLTPDTIGRVFGATDFGFLYAPVYHPALARLSPLRKTLGFPTLFNILGPLLHPCELAARVIGVADCRLGEVFAQTLLLMGCTRAMVVWGEEGLDEISPSGPTQIWRIKPSSRSIYQSVLTPASFGLKSHPLSDVAGSSPTDNAVLVRCLLAGELEENDPVRDFVLMNAAALLVIAGKCREWREGVALARDALQTGAARRALERFAAVSQTIKQEQTAGHDGNSPPASTTETDTPMAGHAGGQTRRQPDTSTTDTSTTDTPTADTSTADTARR